MQFFRKLIKNLPTFLTALAFAIAVWVSAVSQADPTETRVYPQPIELEVIGQNPNLIIVNNYTEEVALTLRAPSTILDQLASNSNQIEATLDLSGLDSGVHNLTPQVNIGLEPVDVVRINPATIFIELETIVTETFPILVNTIGNPAVGFETATPQLSTNVVRIRGAQSVVESVERVVAEVDVDEASATVEQEVSLTAYDSEDIPIADVTLNPETVTVTIPIEQRGGYRTVGVKPVTTGELADGYRLLNIFSVPPTVTVFSSDPNLVESLPSSIETTPININGAEETLETRVTLDLPEGVNVVGSQFVTVRIEIEPIIDSRRFTNIPVMIEGLGAGLDAVLSPEDVDVILEGPVAILDGLTADNILIVVDLTDLDRGVYTLTPEVRLDNEELTIESLLPGTIEVTIN
jgi:YbbR domain-containing protein